VARTAGAGVVIAALDIARVNLLRALRNRSDLFFVFLLPLVIIVALGAMYGGFGTARLGVVGVDSGVLGDDLVSLLEEGDLSIEMTYYDTIEGLRGAVEDGAVQSGLVIPAGYDQTLRDGGDAELRLVARPEDRMSALRQGIDAAVAQQSAQVRAARVAGEHAGSDFETALERARATQAALPGLDVTVTTVGTSIFPADSGAYAFGAQGMVILFMFLTSMTAATQLVLTRQLGVSKRMLATRTPVSAILLGELLGRFSIAMMQGVFIVLVSSLLFGVAWGNLLGATLVVVLFALIGTGVAMIIGVFAKNPDQAGAFGVAVGLILAALGGAMVPAELFDEPMSTISRLTPHAWAIDALRDLSFRAAGVSDILVQLAVLGAMALGLVIVGTWALRRSLTRN
jgi:ABC-2 type transport system permease protein